MNVSPDATLFGDRHQGGPVVHAEEVAAAAAAAVDLDGVAPLHPPAAGGMVSGTHLMPSRNLS